MAIRSDFRRLAAAQRSKQQVATPEYQLVEHVSRIDRHRQGRVALHLHLSQLQPHHRRDHYLRVARSTVEALILPFDGHVFSLRNHDIFVFARDLPDGKLDEAVAKVRFLFADDPLAESGADGAGFCDWYVVERDFPRLAATAQRLYDAAEVASREASREAASGDAAGPGPDQRVPVEPAQLGRLEEMLEKADLSSVIRNQAACAVTVNGIAQPIFDELYVSIAELEQTVLPGVSLTADRWLFQYLTQVLDRRVLWLVERDTQRNPDRAFSLNLNVATLLSEAFVRFDQTLHSRLRGRVVVEVQLWDVYADLTQFMLARDFLRDRGYRVCLDGCTHLTLQMIDREKLGFDLVKLLWAPELVTARPAVIEEIRQAVVRAGTARVILARCDKPESIEVGRSLGISLFQGRHIVQMLRDQNPPSKRHKPAAAVRA